MAIIKTYPDSKTLAIEAASHVVECARDAISNHGFFSLVLAGGFTPRATYEVLATVEFVQRIEWEKVHIFWGDERCVSPNHEDSNYRMAFEILLKHLPIPVKQIYRMKGEIEPKEAAKEYENWLQSFFGGRAPRFDLILLGLGDDGHTASLFPDTRAVSETKRLVLDNYVKKLSTWRLTMTPQLINQAINVAFLVSGEGKAAILRRVLAGRYTPEEIPAQIIRPEHGNMRWLLDAEAAALL
jgi:6-phosphogluconolactonase